MWDSNPRILCKDFALKAKRLNHSDNRALLYITFAFGVSMKCVWRLRNEDTYFSAEYIRFHQSVNCRQIGIAVE